MNTVYPLNDEKGNYCWRNVSGKRIKIYQHLGLSGSMKESGKFDNNNKNKLKDLKTLDEQIDYIRQNEDKLYDIVENSNNYDKELCLFFQERNNFNGNPKVLNKDEFDKLSDKDYIKVHRGFHDSEKTAEKYIEQFKYGNNEYGNGGIQYGVGHYTILDEKAASQYGKTIEIAIPKNAKIIEHDDLLEQHYRNFEKYNDNLEKYYNKYGDKTTTILDYMNNNESATAILSNYDVVKKNDMYIVLNRSIIIVKGEETNER